MSGDAGVPPAGGNLQAGRLHHQGPGARVRGSTRREELSSMADSWLIRVYNDQVLALFKECIGPVELGRQDDRAGEGLYQVSPLPERGCRIAIARNDERSEERRVGKGRSCRVLPW